MRNMYLFSMIESRIVMADESERSRIFFDILAFRNSAHNLWIADDVKQISASLADGNYYLAHNETIHKGRVIHFCGDLCLVDRNGLIQYLEHSLANGDARNVFFTLASSNRIEVVYELFEESCFHVHENKSPQ